MRLAISFVSNDYFEKVAEYVIRTEFQGMGTLHVHIAMWALLRDLSIAGTSGKVHHSDLIKLLESHGFSTVDIQIGSGHLNYIIGYTAKAHDSLDFRVSELASAGGNSRWKMTYRLLCKSSPCVPEVYCDFAGLQMMQRSFYKDKLFAIVPKPQ